jgi:nucleotide-binding universal stress UspA family protein
LCTTLDDNSIEVLSDIRHDISLKHAIIHFVQIVEIQVFTSESVAAVYPEEKDYAEIERGSTNKMKKLAEAIGLEPDKCVFKCFFELNRETKIINYLSEVKADLVVTSTRGKHGIAGFFSSSFTDFLCKFSPCDVLVMRPRAKKQ